MEEDDDYYFELGKRRYKALQASFAQSKEEALNNDKVMKPIITKILYSLGFTLESQSDPCILTDKLDRDSPCIKQCKRTLDGQRCAGCGRTIEEIIEYGKTKKDTHRSRPT